MWVLQTLYRPKSIHTANLVLTTCVFQTFPMKSKIKLFDSDVSYKDTYNDINHIFSKIQIFTTELSDDCELFITYIFHHI